MRVIGITGGVGSGKSALLEYIGTHYNCRIIRSDEAGHEVMLPGGRVYAPLVRLLSQYPADTAIAGNGMADGGSAACRAGNNAGQGTSDDIEADHAQGKADQNLEHLLCPDGTINRPEMAARIFAHPDLRQKVNDLIHPAVREYIMEGILEAKQKGGLDYFFIEAALLIECGYGQVVDEMWYIYCRPEVRRARLRASRGYSDEKIDAIMKSQLSDEEFRRSSDVVIDNSGTLEEACRQIDAHLSGANPVSF